VRLDRAVSRLRTDEARAGFTAEALCFGPQRKFVDDKRDVVVACTTRRAGKTVGNRMRLLLRALGQDGVTVLYVAQTRGVAEELCWRGLKQWNKDFGLGGKTNDTKLILTLPNGSRIRCGGAKDKKEADKLRGPEKVGEVIVDEAQNFRQDVIEYLINDIVEPGMMDVGGSIVITGTPGPIPAGYFFEATKNAAYSHHFWTLHQNPHLGVKPADFLARIRERRKITEANPTYRREYLGEWVHDTDALVLHYDVGRNAGAWQAGPQQGWRYVVAFDIGFDDSDAIVVLGWGPHSPKLHLVREIVVPKQGISELAGQLQGLIAAFRPVKVVGDLGGLGKKIGEELRRRWTIPVEPADKQRKAEHVALLDDALRLGNFTAPADSRFAGDCAIVVWDADARARGELKIARQPHSDVMDAALYGYRLAYHWAERPAPPPKTEPERMDEWEQREAERVEQEKQQEWWELA
jgi:hypothetical protein